ncbi:MAG: MFS transporter [Pseudomonadota bacterium]
MPTPRRSWQTLAILALTQVLSWGTLYYALAIVALDIAHEMGWRNEVVYGAFSWCLLVAGLAATPAGALLDRYGGRRVMAAGSLLCGLGFIVLATAHSIAAYLVAWTVLGVAMAGVLYEAAFATINFEFGLQARQAISRLTLVAGFASTVFWPVTLKLNALLGWRETYLWYAAIQLLVCMPLHLMLGTQGAPMPTHQERPDHSLKEALRHHAFWKLAFAFAANSFVFSALSAHLIPILQHYGHPAGTVVFMAALIGPMQVLGRIGEMTFARHIAPQQVGKFTFAMLPLALLALLFFGAHLVAVGLFCILYGLSNGILTIVRGTIPQQLFGARNYGAISGAMAGPAMVARAAGPLVLAGVLQANASPALVFMLLLCCAIASLLFYLMAVRTAPPVPSAIGS